MREIQGGKLRNQSLLAFRTRCSLFFMRAIRFKFSPKTASIVENDSGKGVMTDEIIKNSEVTRVTPERLPPLGRVQWLAVSDSSSTPHIGWLHTKIASSIIFHQLSLNVKFSTFELFFLANYRILEPKG